MNELISIIFVLLMATPRERVGNLARSSTATHNPIPTHAPTNQTCALHTGASPPALLAQHLDSAGGTIFTAPVRTQRLTVVALSPFAAQNFPGVPGVQLQLATMAVSHAPRHVIFITSMAWSGPPSTW